MKQNDFLQQVFRSLEPKYNKVNLIFTLILFGTGFSFFLREGFLFIAILDIVFGIIGLFLHIYRDKIRLSKKMLLTVSLLLVFSVQSLIRGGFMGNGIVGLCMVTVLAIAFLDSWSAKLAVFLVLLVIGGLTIAIYIGVFDLNFFPIERYYAKADWIYQTVSIGAFVLVAYFSILSMRKMLLNSMLELSELAYKDNLTGLNNRNYFTGALLEEDFEDKRAIMAILDIVNFRLINHIYGVEAGDKFLVKLAEIMKEYVGKKAYLARVGSNEFALLGIGWSVKELKRLENEGLKRFNDTNHMIGLIPRQRYIIAYTEVDFGTEVKNNFLQAFKNVGIALKYGKEQNTSGLITFEESMRLAYEDDANIQSRIEEGLLKDQFYMNYQGKWSIKHQRICGFEALARWKVDGVTNISPSVFIPIITKSAYLDDFSRVIIRKIMADFQEIQSHFAHKVTISINISPIFFLKNNFEVFLISEIERTSIAFNQIILEITEDIFISDYHPINEKIQALRKKGMKFSLDDFGSGYSSLNHLSNIEIDELKIDKSIIQELGMNDKANALCTMIIGMGKQLNCKVVAEGVETEVQAQMTQDAGCDLIQGYYYAMPLDKDTIIASTNKSDQ